MPSATFSPITFFLLLCNKLFTHEKIWEQYMSVACEKKEKETNAVQLIKKNM